MNPLAALLLPLSALVVAGTTISAVTAVTADPAAGAPSAAADRFGPPTGAAVARPVTGPVTGPVVGPGLRDRWGWPLQPQPPVVRPFLRPATRYGAGHRGVDLAGAAGQDVLAVEAGTVTHVGRIAGRGTVTVLHASGVRSTYQPVAPAVRTGEAVPRGAALGRLEPAGSHCGSAPCLHLGAIRDADYLDPLVFLLGGRRVRLLPLAQAPDG
jgi:murein DD-endopeptidase MepM/ murein hydrolase activator NlpD